MAKKYDYNNQNFTYFKVSTPKGDLDFIMLKKYLEKNKIIFSDYIRNLIEDDILNPKEMIARPTKMINAPFYSQSKYKDSVERHSFGVKKNSEIEAWLLSKPKKATYLLSLIIQDIQKNKELYYK